MSCSDTWSQEHMVWEARLFALVILFKITRTVHRTVLQELYLSRVSKRAGKITLDPSHQHTHSLNCYCLVDATDLWAPERPDTETVSFPKQSISWTLDIKRGAHSTIIQLFIHHTYLFFHFKFAHIRPYTQMSVLNIVPFCTLPICILFFCCILCCILCPVLSLSFCSTVELLSL